MDSDRNSNRLVTMVQTTTNLAIYFTRSIMHTFLCRCAISDDHCSERCSKTVVPNLPSLAYPLAAYFQKVYPFILAKTMCYYYSCCFLKICFPSLSSFFFSCTPKHPASYPQGKRVPQVGNHCSKKSLSGLMKERFINFSLCR